MFGLKRERKHHKNEVFKRDSNLYLATFTRFTNVLGPSPKPTACRLLTKQLALMQGLPSLKLPVDLNVKPEKLVLHLKALQVTM